MTRESEYGACARICPLHAELRTETLYKESREIDDWRLLSEPQWVRRNMEFVFRTGLVDSVSERNSPSTALSVSATIP